ncbi:MAG: hypothetical protein IV100_21945 [Myxococcales bacterium]|nr:hypothetical protein [Myxococcales bacterium]
MPVTPEPGPAATRQGGAWMVYLAAIMVVVVAPKPVHAQAKICSTVNPPYYAEDVCCAQFGLGRGVCDAGTGNPSLVGCTKAYFDAAQSKMVLGDVVCGFGKGTTQYQQSLPEKLQCVPVVLNQPLADPGTSTRFCEPQHPQFSTFCPCSTQAGQQACGGNGCGGTCGKCTGSNNQCSDFGVEQCTESTSTGGVLSLELSCPEGKRITVINDARLRTGAGLCSSAGYTPACEGDGARVRRYVTNMCLGKYSCTLSQTAWAAAGALGSPCAAQAGGGNPPLSFSVSYRCGARTTSNTCGPGGTASCVGKVCGDDGAGGSCGSCPAGSACTPNGTCYQCSLNCAGRTCGTDGCGGSCGTCAAGQVCGTNGTCQCVPQCQGKTCGPDGCGGWCGTHTGLVITYPGECDLQNCINGQWVQKHDPGVACNDNNPCTTEACSAGVCRNYPRTGTFPDPNAPTSLFTCQSGTLVTTAAKTCPNDNNPCTVDTPNAVTGACHLPITGPCDDAQACTENDQCTGGLCRGTAKSCDDGDPCTEDVCSQGAGGGPSCANTLKAPNSTCDDGQPCTMNDVCLTDAYGDFVCRGVKDPCDDGNACTVGTCSVTSASASGQAPQKVCTQTATIGLACNDQNPCTTGDRCETNAGGSSVVCAGQSATCSLPATCSPNAAPVCQCAAGQAPKLSSEGQYSCCTQTCNVRPSWAGESIPALLSTCGPDGCGGSCGSTCPAGQACMSAFYVYSYGGGGWNKPTGPVNTASSVTAYRRECLPAPSTTCSNPTGTVSGLTARACCDGRKVVRCEGGAPVVEDCAAKGMFCAASGTDVSMSYACVPNRDLASFAATGPASYAAKYGDWETSSPRQCPATTCVPNCTGKQCGMDGCGGFCGACPTGQSCLLDSGTCQAGCGGLGSQRGCFTQLGQNRWVINYCPISGGTEANATQVLCNGAGQPPKVTSVNGKPKLVCGGSGADATGSESWRCPSYGACGCGYGLAKKTCGTNSCGTGSCGTCPAGQSCSSFGTCCTPSCGGSTCGDDGCGGSCGTCSGGQVCSSVASGGVLVRQCAAPPPAGVFTCKPWYYDYPQCVPQSGGAASQLKYCGGPQNLSITTLACPAGSSCTCSSSYNCGCLKPQPTCVGHCGQALEGCSCASTCVAAGNCCHDFDGVCGADVVTFRCGDQVCDANRAETALTCPADCGAASGTYADYVPRRVRAAAQPHQSVVTSFAEYDDVALTPSPVPLLGLVARLTEPGVLLGPPDTRASVFDGMSNEYLGNQDAAVAAPVGVSGRGIQTGPKVVLVEPADGELVGAPSWKDRKVGGFAAAGYVKWGGKDPKQTRVIGNGAASFDSEQCLLGLPGQERATAWCPEGTQIASMEAYYGTLTLPGPAVEGGSYSCAEYRRATKSGACSSPDVAAAAAACATGQKRNCVVDVPSVPACASTAPMRLAIRWTCGSQVGSIPPTKGLRLALGAAANAGAEKAVLRLERADGSLIARSEREVVRDQWAHVAVVYEPVTPANGSVGTAWANVDGGQNGGVVRLFIDGDVVAQVELKDELSMPAWVWGASAHKLELDELYLYRRALEDGEVRRLRDLAAGRAPLRVWPPVDAATLVRKGYFAVPGTTAPSVATANTWIGAINFIPIWANFGNLLVSGPDASLSLVPPMPAMGADLDNLTEWELNTWVYGPASGDVLRVMQGDVPRLAVRVVPCSYAPAYSMLNVRFPSGVEVNGRCDHAPSPWHWHNIGVQQRKGAYLVDLDGSRVTVTSTSSAPLFDVGGAAARSLEIKRTFTWAALYPGPLGDRQRAQLRRTGPSVWLNGENIEGDPAPFDYGSFGNIYASDTSFYPFSPFVTGTGTWSRAFPPRTVLDKVSGGTAAFTVPLGARLALASFGDPAGAIRPLTVSATLSDIPYATGESPIFTLRKGTEPYAAGRLDCTLQLAAGDPQFINRWLSCRVLVAVQIAGTTKTYRSAPFMAFRTIAAPNGPPADARRLRISLSLPGTTETPRLAIGWPNLADVTKEGSWGGNFAGDFTEPRTLVPLGVSPTPLAFEAVVVPGESGGDGLYFPSKAGWTSGTAKISNMRIYDRQESGQGLLLALGATCADLRCADAGRTCVQAHDAVVCGTCLAGSSEIGGTCVERKPYYATCRFGRDAECGDGLSCRAGRCVYAAKTASCDATCLTKGALCVPRDKAAWGITAADAPVGGYACSVEPGWVTPPGAPSRPIQCAEHHVWTVNDAAAAKAGEVVADQTGGATSAGRCEWRPPMDEGERCTSPLECGSAACIQVARPQYRLDGVTPSTRRFLTWRLGRRGSSESSAPDWFLPQNLSDSLVGKTEGDAQDITYPIGDDATLAARVPGPQFPVSLSPTTTAAAANAPTVGECAIAVVTGADAAARARCKARNMNAVRRAAQVFDRLTGYVKTEDRWVCEGCLEEEVNIAPAGQPVNLQRLYRPAWSLLSPDACKTIVNNYSNYRFGLKLAEERSKNEPRTNYSPTPVPLPQPRVKRAGDGQGLEFQEEDRADWTLLATMKVRPVYHPINCNKLFGFIPTNSCTGGEVSHYVDETYYPLRAIKVGATDYLYGVPDQDVLGLAASWALKNWNSDSTTFNAAALSPTDFITYLNQVKARWTKDLGNQVRRGDILDAPITIGTLRALLRTPQDDPEPGAHPQPLDYATLSSLGVGPALIRMASAGVRGDATDQGLGHATLNVGMAYDQSKEGWLFGDLRQRAVLGACSTPTFALRYFLPRRSWTDPNGHHYPINAALDLNQALTAGVNWNVLWGKPTATAASAEGTRGVDYEDITAASPFADPDVNRAICIANQFPEGSVCPPPGQTPNRATDGQWCLSGFCDPSTGRCADGQLYVEDRSGDDRSNRPSGGDAGWAPDLTQQKGSYFRLDDVTKAPRLNAVTNKNLWKTVTSGQLINPKFNADKRSYELTVFTRVAFSMLKMIQLTLVDAYVYLQAVPGLPDGMTGRVERVTSLDVLSLKLTDHLKPVQDGIDKAQKSTESLKDTLFGNLPGCKIGAVTWKNGEWDNQASCKLNRKTISIKPKPNPKGLNPAPKTEPKKVGAKPNLPASVADPVSATVNRVNIPLPLGKCDIDPGPPPILPNTPAFPPGELELPGLPIKLEGLPGARLCYTMNPVLNQPNAFLEFSAEPSLGVNYGGDLDQSTLEPVMRVGYEVGVLITAKAFVKIAAKKTVITETDVPVDDLPFAPMKEEKTEKKVIQLKIGVKVAIDLITFTHDFLYGVSMTEQPNFKDLWRAYQGRGTELGLRFLKVALSVFIEVKVWKIGIEFAYKLLEFAGIRIVLPGGTFDKDGSEWLVDFRYEPPPIPKDALKSLKTGGGQ